MAGEDTWCLESINQHTLNSALALVHLVGLPWALLMLVFTDDALALVCPASFSDPHLSQLVQRNTPRNCWCSRCLVFLLQRTLGLMLISGASNLLLNQAVAAESCLVFC